MSSLRHVDPSAPRGPFYRALTRLLATRPMGAMSRAIGWKIDPYLMRLSRGRLGFGLVMPTAVLETRGARTGKTRRNVLVYFHDADRVTLMASKLGLPEHPAWFHNIRANPDVTFGGQMFRASVVSDPREAERLWRLADRVFPGYAAYRQRAAAVGRTIPIVQLVPR